MSQLNKRIQNVYLQALKNSNGAGYISEAEDKETEKKEDAPEEPKEEPMETEKEEDSETGSLIKKDKKALHDMFLKCLYMLFVSLVKNDPNFKGDQEKTKKHLLKVFKLDDIGFKEDKEGEISGIEMVIKESTVYSDIGGGDVPLSAIIDGLDEMPFCGPVKAQLKAMFQRHPGDKFIGTTRQEF